MLFLQHFRYFGFTLNFVSVLSSALEDLSPNNIESMKTNSPPVIIELQKSHSGNQIKNNDLSKQPITINAKLERKSQKTAKTAIQFTKLPS